MAICVSLCLSVPHYIPTLLRGLRCNFGNGRGCPLVVHYWADLQSVHGFRCCDNIALNATCQRVLVLAVWLVGVLLYGLCFTVTRAELLKITVTCV